MKDQTEEFFEWLVEVQKRHVWAFLFGMFFITGIFAFFALNVQIDSTLDAQLLPTGDYLTLRDVMSREFGQTDSVFIVVRQTTSGSTTESVDMRNAKVFAALDDLEKSLGEEPEVNSITSINTLLKGAFGKLPQTDEEARQQVSLLGDSAKSFISRDFSATVMFVSINSPAETSAKVNLEKRIDRKVENAPFPEGTEAISTGFPKLLNRIISLMITDSITTLALSLTFIFFLLLFLFRKLSLAIIAVLPVAVAAIWLAGSMTILGIKLSLANATVAAMIIGLGVDYGVHVVNTFDNRVRNREKSPVTATMRLAGVALFVSFITTFIGFSINAFGTTEAVRSQALTLTLGITYSYIATVLLVPPLLKLKMNVLRHEHGETKWK